MQIDRSGREIGVRPNQNRTADEVLKREWSEREAKLQNTRDALNEIRQKKTRQAAPTARSVATQKSREVSLNAVKSDTLRIDEDLFPIERSSGGVAVRPEAFDMKADLDAFIRPPLISGQMIEREKLEETAKKIIMILEQKDANPELIKKAVRLLNEERQVKSLLSGYRNSLIFS